VKVIKFTSIFKRGEEERRGQEEVERKLIFSEKDQNSGFYTDNFLHPRGINIPT